MTSTIYWINDDQLGEQRLGTMARPRGNDWLEDEIRGLKFKAVDYVVSLLEKSEEWELGIEREEELCAKWGIEFIRFPIQDVTTPKNADTFIALASKLAQQISQGKKMVIHCRMGIGRSSMLAAAIMIKLGCAAEDVFDTIRTYRKMEVPDTKEQKDWVLSIADQLK